MSLPPGVHMRISASEFTGNANESGWVDLVNDAARDELIAAVREDREARIAFEHLRFCAVAAELVAIIRKLGGITLRAEWGWQRHRPTFH